MNASQRLADVKKLRDDVCHGFFKLILVPGWQNALYNMATQEVTNNGRFRDAYSETYTKMRAKGASNYTVDDMDVSIMRTVASFWNSRSNSGTNFSPMKQNTLDALKNVKEDRNIGGHSSSNEDEEELYLQGLLSLINLQQFIKAVDKNETQIPDPDRLAYFQHYNHEIDALKNTLDEERIKLVQVTKDMDADIERIKNSNDPEFAWAETTRSLLERWRIQKGNEGAMEAVLAFAARASDAGIKSAHMQAVTHFVIENNEEEAIKRIRMHMEAYPKMPLYECNRVLFEINYSLMHQFGRTDNIQNLIADLKARGFTIEERDGKYVLPEWEAHEKEQDKKRKQALEEAGKWEIRIQKK